MSFRHQRRIDWAEVDRLKGLLNTFFKMLRAQGFLARQDFSCCGGCGMSELANVVETSKKTFKGVVFYHHQDTEGVKTGEGTYLVHSPATKETDDDARKAVGQRVVEIAKSCGLNVEWDGEPGTRIWVSSPPKPVPPPVFLGEGI